MSAQVRQGHTVPVDGHASGPTPTPLAVEVPAGRVGGGSDVCPRWSPTSAVLDDLSMILLGAYIGVHGPAIGSCDPPAPGDCPVLPRLIVPSDVAHASRAAGRLELLDEEGAPYAVLHLTECAEVSDGQWALAGILGALADPARGSHRHLCRPARGESPLPDYVLAVLVDRPFAAHFPAQVRAVAEDLEAHVLLLPTTGAGRPQGTDGSALVRICLAQAASLGADVVPICLPQHGPPSADAEIVRSVAGAYGATHLVRLAADGADLPTAAGPVPVDLPPVALDLRTTSWAPTHRVPAQFRSARTVHEAQSHLQAVLQYGSAPDADLFDATTLRELQRLRPGRRRGFTVLFTGLSGSGKSTTANAVREAILDRTDRTVTLLDGDVVRRMLSSELSFSREHRELNVRRIGFVASHITAHGGIALCAPIAPYDRSRREVREMIETAGGGFLLVHVATPLAACEARDSKGLYARARAGTIPAFTGISDPYEEPRNADVVTDTSVEPLDRLVERILDAAADRGWLDLG